MCTNKGHGGELVVPAVACTWLCWLTLHAGRWPTLTAQLHIRSPALVGRCLPCVVVARPLVAALAVCYAYDGLLWVGSGGFQRLVCLGLHPVLGRHVGTRGPACAWVAWHGRRPARAGRTSHLRLLGGPQAAGAAHEPTRGCLALGGHEALGAHGAHLCQRACIVHGCMLRMQRWAALGYR